jgi:glyoxylase-like metal-dependent hydrolase (beta-lactamase superfamily II)
VAEETYRFTVGEFDLVSLNDGYHDYEVGAFFANVPQDRVEEALRSRGLPTDRIASPYACLYVNTGQNRVLIDTGLGGWLPTTGRLPAALRSAAISATDIDTVIITHAHGDHLFGVVDAAGELAFPNARVYIWKRESDFWLSEDAPQRFPHREAIEQMRKILKTIHDCTSFIDPDCDVVPGVTALAASGHTPGHIAVRVSSSGDSVLHISDTIFHPLHLEHPDWLPASMLRLEPDAYLESMRRVLDLAADESALVLATHFNPFPCLGHVTRMGQGWHWQPIDTTTRQ